MTDITELAQSLRRRAASANEFGEGLFFIKADDVLALLEALEKAQDKIIVLQQKYEIDPRTHEIIDLEEHVAELESEVEKWKQEAEVWEKVAEKQLATAIELEARTVKLPELCVGVVQGGHAVMVPYPAGHWFNKTAILEMLAAAGIKVEAE